MSRRARRRDAQLGRWVCDGLTPVSLQLRLARGLARAAALDDLEVFRRKVEHAHIECRIEMHEVLALRVLYRRRWYAIVDAELVTRQKREDPLSRVSVRGFPGPRV